MAEVLAVVAPRVRVGDLTGEAVEGEDEDDEFAAVDLAAVRDEGDEVVAVFLVETVVGEGPRGEAVGVDPTEGGLVGRELTTEVTERERVAAGATGALVGDDKADLLGDVAVVTVIEGREAAVEGLAVDRGEEVGDERTFVVVALRVGRGLVDVVAVVEDVPRALEGALVGVPREEEGGEGAVFGPEKVEAIADIAGETAVGERVMRVRLSEEALAEAVAGE